MASATLPVSYTHLDVYKRQGLDPTGLDLESADDLTVLRLSLIHI